MRRLLSAVFGLVLAGGLSAQAQDPVADRAVEGAKAYVKAKNLAEPKLTILLSSLYNNSFPDFARKWEELTGVKMEIVPLGYTDIPAKIMQEGVSKTGVYDLFNDFPYTMPDAVGAKVIRPLDDYAAKYKPDFSGIPEGLKGQQYYDGKLYTFINDGDHLIFVLRRDLIENPQAKAEYRAKFGKDPDCPDTLAEWEQMAAFFHTKEGETRWGIKFAKPLYGALGYRSINFSYRHFPAYMDGLLFDKDMKPRINTPQGIKAIKDFASIVTYMPKDVQGWGTPQIYPFWGSGQAFSAMSFPSLYGFGESNPASVVKGQQKACLMPGRMAGGKLVRRSPQAAGTGYMVSAYSKNPELAYLFTQWLTSPSVGADAVAHPKGFWDPFRESHRTHKGIVERFGKDFVEVTLENAQYASSLLLIEGNYEYFKILDNNLADVMNDNISAEEAAKRIESGWNKVTDDIGRDSQIKVWRKGVEGGIYLDTF
ncbi:MAG: extracellular solute-binding protein [Variibacter sp.]|nr:extracellular solute-binding protein [Variibacter sp.]